MLTRNNQGFKNESRLEKYAKKWNHAAITHLKCKFHQQVHKENQTVKLKADEKGVKDLTNLFAEFECDPFDSMHTVVTTLHSEEVASVKFKEDFATAHAQG